MALKSASFDRKNSKLYHYYGEKLIDECEAAARDLVHALAAARPLG